ncbi:AfsR/SARP family transcriptional regulator [Pseudonocardia spinosispora]|uniref:AfsR/SARP family transcriptional regulator n=1 Tax=Pseudonocardia spinosispora TaxID=103441 RepID=UPI0024812CDD|nr:BTAD domain-containing putative transcriptional regulator [Pseudonocardia spinosispora]
MRTGSPQQRAVLAMLLLHDGRSVSFDAIVEMLWGARIPPAAAGTVRTYVSRIRSTFGGAGGDEGKVRLEAYGDGYRLIVDRSAVDVDLFRGHLAQARLDRRYGDLVSAARRLEEALVLWRGRPLAGIGRPAAAVEPFGATPPYFRGRISWLEQLRSSAVEERFAVQIELGDFAGAIKELEEAVATDPYHERMWELLISAQRGAGRIDDAMASFRVICRRLDDEFGLGPGPGLRELYRRLRADPVGRSAR